MTSIDEIHQRRLYSGKNAYLSITYSRWRAIHLFSLSFALCCSFTSWFTYFVFKRKFDPHCPLYATLAVKKEKDYDQNPLNYKVILQREGRKKVTHWGPDGVCSFVFYEPLINIVAALLWILLFALKGGFSPNSQIQLVPPTSVCGFLVTILSFVASMVLTRGAGIFCDSFKRTELKECESAQYVRWTNFPEMQGFYDYLLRSQITLWLATHSWLFHSVVSVIRWSTNADYVIAEERELRENPLDIFAMPSSAVREPSTGEISSSKRESSHAESDAESDRCRDLFNLTYIHRTTERKIQ